MFSNLRTPRAAFGANTDTEFKPHTKWINFKIVAICGFGSFMFGYANNIISGSLAQISFQKAFISGLDADSVIGGILGGFLGGGLIGALLQARLSSKYGRKMATRIAAVLFCISAVLMATSYHIAQFIVGRIICGLASGIVVTNCPVYMSEVSPPHSRGMLTGAHTITMLIGYVSAALFSLIFYFVKHDYAWRLQFVMLTFGGLLLLGSPWFIPESPRWLIENGKNDEAWEILKTLHASPNDPEYRLAHLEMTQIKAEIEAQRTLPTGYIHIFRTPALRKRAFCCILVWLMGQSTGILVVANFAPALFGGLGYDTVLQLGLSVVWTMVVLIGCFFNAMVIDKFGRVKLIVLGGFSCAATLLAEGLIQKYYLGTDYAPGLRAGVAMFFAFGLVYGMFFDGAAFVYISEIWPTHVRSEGATIGVVTFFGANIAYNSPASLAFATIGWKYYIIFVALCVSLSVFMLFYLPEVSGLTLEEIGAQFGDKVETEVYDADLDASKELESRATAGHVDNCSEKASERVKTDSSA